MKPRMPSLCNVVSALLALSAGYSNAFVYPPQQRAVHDRPRSATQVFSSVVADADAHVPIAAPPSALQTVQLNFAGQAVVTSEAAAVDESKPLHDFFALPHAAPLILRGSKNNRVTEVERVDAKLYKMYERACARADATPPSPSDRIFEITTSGVSLPGLRVQSLATIGVKIIASAASNNPCYELVVIRDATRVKGRFFTNPAGDPASSESTEQTTFSVNRISVVPKENGAISFESKSNLSILLEVPSLLMRAIPGASRERLERTGGAALQKTLEEDLTVSLEEFRREYVRWIGEESSSKKTASGLMLDPPANNRRWRLISRLGPKNYVKKMLYSWFL